MSATTSRADVATVNLGPVDRIPAGEGRNFDVGGRSIAVFRTRRGKVLATQAACPHKRGPLADGIVGECMVICPLHSYKFDLETGAPVGHTCGALETFPAAVSETGDILLSVIRT